MPPRQPLTPMEPMAETQPAAPEAAPPAAAEKMQAPRQWALEKYGMDDGKKGRKLTPKGAFLFGGAQHQEHWVEGDEVTEAAFDQAVAKFAGSPVGR